MEYSRRCIRCILIILSLFLISGCSFKMSTRSGDMMLINSVGDSMPNNEITLSNSASGITARAMLIAEENMLDMGADEVFIFRSNPQIRFGESLTMRDSVTNLLLRINVHNPKNIFHKIVLKTWEGGLQRSAQPTETSILYEGKLTINEKMVKLPSDRPLATEVAIQDERSNNLMWFGPFGYTVSSQSQKKGD